MLALLAQTGEGFRSIHDERSEQCREWPGQAAGDRPRRRGDQHRSRTPAAPPQADEDAARTEARPSRTGAQRPRAALWIIAALILGLIGRWLALPGRAGGLFPLQRDDGDAARLDALEANGSGLADELAALKQAADGAAQTAATAGEDGRAAAQQAYCRGRRWPASIAASARWTSGSQPPKRPWRPPRPTSTSCASPVSRPPAPRTGSTRGHGRPRRPRPAHRRAGEGRGEPQVLRRRGRRRATASVTSALSQALSDLKAKVAAGTSYPAGI